MNSTQTTGLNWDAGLPILRNTQLRERNSLGFAATAELSCVIRSAEQIPLLMSTVLSTSMPWRVLGGGSNVVLPAHLPGITLLMEISGQALISNDQTTTQIRVGAGVNWHEFVTWSVEQGLPGLENLALIPGTTGAAPIQNIGAYGVEVSDLIQSITAFDCTAQQVVELTPAACQFAYRDSLFKRHPQRYIISAVTFSLPNAWAPQLQYADLTNFFSSQKNLPSPTAIFDAVCTIRQKKLPDPKVIGNVGSFFKNPTVSQTQLTQLFNTFPKMIAYPQSNGSHKLAAGWLIEQCGFKGAQRGAVGVFEKQALVLVNLGKGTATELLTLASEIQSAVQDRFGVLLEIEPVRM
ncbi:UDP-N-acetylmuramate dehydrogenase [Polynucleobacter sp. IMCC 30228]|uniref:UDP-N-acetylmuramate dehydrogenase n=1 Tax=Polynucleobacter sp. IMCC 30228 TaxID=2781011 RepID=UPI001F30436B|nr:UDP-N-acetylmuramate dehydrogenase [Polynucleobacter sp. IMCC 30228]MCE7525989.1 UDP-N-acetylmuramate dehydrogenase [Polynucleobacter sp. IMCC 30228]